jgi:hypothetical protein
MTLACEIAATGARFAGESCACPSSSASDGASTFTATSRLRDSSRARKTHPCHLRPAGPGARSAGQARPEAPPRCAPRPPSVERRARRSPPAGEAARRNASRTRRRPETSSAQRGQRIRLRCRSSDAPGRGCRSAGDHDYSIGPSPTGGKIGDPALAGSFPAACASPSSVDVSQVTGRWGGEPTRTTAAIPPRGVRMPTRLVRALVTVSLVVAKPAGPS